MAQGLRDLLMKQHKFAGHDEVLEAKVFERMSGKSEDFEELTKRVRSILISAGKPCHVSEVERDYRNLFGKKFPVWEIGFSTATDVLNNLPEACTVEDHDNDPLVVGKTTEKNVHIFDFVKKSKSKPKKLAVKGTTAPPQDLFVPFNVQDGIRQILYRKSPIKKDEFYKLLEDKYDMQYMGLNVSVDILIRSLPHLLHGDSVSVKRAYNIQKHEIQIPEHFHFEDEHVIPSYRLSKLEAQIAANISTLLKEEHPLYVREIPHLYKKRIGKELNWNQLGFQDLWRFLQLIPGNFKLIKIDSDYVAAPPELDTSGTTNVRNFEAKHFCGELVYRNILKKIERLVLQVNRGLNSKYLKSAYEALYYEKLVIKEDFREFLQCLHYKLIFTLRVKGDDNIIYPSNIQDEEEQKLRPTKISKPISTEIVYPEHILKPGDSIGSLDFGKAITLHDNQFCAGYVVSIESPSKFYIRIVGMGPDHNGELYKEFIDQKESMKKLYTLYSEKYIIPVTNMKLDMICAVCVKGEWQRAIIVDLLSSTRILVRLLDSGECHAVTLLNIRYLPKEFAKLPCLASKASLFNIKPKLLSWSVSAIQEFHKLTTNRSFENLALSVLIVHRNKDGELQVVLTDKCEGAELHIGDRLEELGHAAFKYEEKIMNTFFC